MPLRVDYSGLARLEARLRRIRHADPTPLLERGERIMAEDNERGILAGTDKDGKPLVPVKARTGKYRGATGPPLAPFGAKSRTIANFATGHGSDPGRGNRWIVAGDWLDVVSRAGIPFLPFHFRGGPRLPRRDLAGVRPQGRARWSAAVADWVRSNLLGG